MKYQISAELKELVANNSHIQRVYFDKDGNFHLNVYPTGLNGKLQTGGSVKIDIEGSMSNEEIMALTPKKVNPKTATAEDSKIQAISDCETLEALKAIDMKKASNKCWDAFKAKEVILIKAAEDTALTSKNEAKAARIEAITNCATLEELQAITLTEADDEDVHTTYQLKEEELTENN
jgi:hypothetical protein